MCKYDNDALAELCSKLDLLDYVSQQYEVKMMAGKHYIRCPLHTDNTPSLCINPETNKFYCFSCEVRGSVLDWFTKIEKMPFNDAIEKLQRLTGSEIKTLKTCEALAFYKSAKKAYDNANKPPIKHEVLPYSFYDKFSKEIPQEWVDEGMSEEVLKEYDIRIDKVGNRIVYPVYDGDDELIGAKGRSRFKAYKELGIAKYMNYRKVDCVDYFAGAKNNRNEILRYNSAIIFEGIKSGLKLTTYTGRRNWLAAETSYLNDYQIRVLLGMGIKDITIAFDSDVDFHKIEKCTEMLRKFTNVYVITDPKHLLGEKESPIDRGIEVFNQLMDTRVRL